MIDHLFQATSTFHDTQIEGQIELNAAHEIFEGHFPERAVLPGVCQLYIVRHLVAHHLKQRLRCLEIKEVKYLHAVLPQESPILDVQLKLNFEQEGRITVQGSIMSQNVQMTKIKATFV